MERPVGKYDEEEERWDGGDEEEHPEKPTIHLFILKWERTPRRAKDRPIFFYLIRKNEKKGPSRQASSTLAGCGRPEPEISRHWISFRRKRNFGQNLILLLPAYLPFPRGPWPPAPSRPPLPAALFWGKLYQTRFRSFDPLGNINCVPPRFCWDFRTCLYLANSSIADWGGRKVHLIVSINLFWKPDRFK